MKNSNQMNENKYVLHTHFDEFIEAIALDKLGVKIIIEPIQLFLETGIIETYSAEIIAKEPDEELLELRTCFYQIFKPLSEQLPPYVRYFNVRDETLQSTTDYAPNIVGEIEIADATMIVLSELNSEAKDRLKKITQIEDIYEKQKKELLTLAQETPKTIELHAALKKTILESPFTGS